MPVTVGDVARVAGVGRGSVSRVLNDHPSVSPALRAKVEAAIAALDFVPSRVARSLSLGRTQTIAVVVPFLTRPSVVERLRGVERSLAAADLDMVVVNLETAERREAAFRENVRPDRIDGLIVFSVGLHEHEVERIAAGGLPVVLVDGHHRRLDRIVVDDVDGGRIAARHLLSLGHRRIAFVGDIPKAGFGFTSTRFRLRGVRDALREAGLALDPSLIALAEHSRLNARLSATRLLRDPSPPTAIIAASDTEAIGVLEAARALGLDVPGDLSVTGYDDVEAADYLGLTTVRQPLLETGDRAVERLLEITAGTDAAGDTGDAPPSDVRPRREVLPVTLVVRRTTGPAPVR